LNFGAVGIGYAPFDVRQTIAMTQVSEIDLLPGRGVIKGVNILVVR
jgi:hypothetical protein